MDIGQVERVDINEEMRSAYLDYAMSTIVARALPDARDGLKPVHRRILFAMHEMGIRPNSSHKKSARIVGEVLGKYHPHGDSAVYESMARMAQEFSLRYMLVDGQGNFGSIGGDPPAAMRYTEARMSHLAAEMLVDIGKDTVDFTDNFDGSLQEPVVLPSRLPNLLLNGSYGIAVGMASNVPPHNLRELAGAINYMIDHYDKPDDVAVEDLMQFVKGPDFPTGGLIVGDEGIRQVYSSGRGKLTVRGRAAIEEEKSGRFRIVITEIPYQLNQTTLIERIAELARDGRLEGISDLRDESDRNGLTIVLELKKGASPRTVLNRLYKYTPLQGTFGAQLLALVKGEPRTLTLKQCLMVFIEHRQEVITRRSQYDLEKARARIHILDGLLIALAKIEDVIKTIRESKDVDTARERLMTRFKLSEIQAQAILDMQLRRLAALERQKIEDEHKEVMQQIAFLEDLLAHPKKILAVVKTDMTEVAEQFGDERRTGIDMEGTGSFNEEDLVKDEAVLISITERGYVKRVAAKAYRQQARGGKGVIGHDMKEEDEVVILLPAGTKDTILFFSDRGKVYSEKAYRLPEAARTAKGSPMINVLGIGPNETITAAVRVRDFKAADYCIMATRCGRIKRVTLDQFESVRQSGLIAIGLDDEDSLNWVRLTTGKDDILLITQGGQALRISESKVRAMGRQAAGVTGIKVKPGDQLASMEVVEPGGDLLVVTTGGYGKRTPLTEYAIKGRATMGVRTIDDKALDEIGRIAAARVVQKGDDLTIMSSGGVIIRTAVAKIKTAGRATRGVRLMNLGEGDTVASLARIAASDLLLAEKDEQNGKAEPGPAEPGPTEDPAA
ncbi:MAG: DNA gyrase subunit A [Anaerolineae bacterium]|nr:MAG: DNA gyrase subunit A [Anaerolineae bacterium]